MGIGQKNMELPTLGVPQKGWLIAEHHVEMDDLGIPRIWKPPYLKMNG